MRGNQELSIVRQQQRSAWFLLVFVVVIISSVHLYYRGMQAGMEKQASETLRLAPSNLFLNNLGSTVQLNVVGSDSLRFNTAYKLEELDKRGIVCLIPHTVKEGTRFYIKIVEVDGKDHPILVEDLSK